MAAERPDTLSGIIAQACPGKPVQSAERMATLPHSAVYRVQFAPDDSVIVKYAGSADFPTSLQREIVINRDVLSALPDKVAPRCYAQQADADLPWMILEDISATHRPLQTDTPTEDIAKQFVGVLARTHAQGRAIDLARAFAAVEGGTHMMDRLDLAALMLDMFLGTVETGTLPKGASEIVRRLKDRLPQLHSLLTGHETLVHGDAHFWNAMYGQDALLLDWELAKIGPGEADLCHALAMNLPRPIAERYEKPCLHHYVSTCSQYGMELIERDLWDRYRMCLLYTVMETVGLKNIPGIEDAVWHRLFTNAVQNAVDHDSLSFLG